MKLADFKFGQNLWGPPDKNPQDLNSNAASVATCRDRLSHFAAVRDSASY